ncbi:hypothetical protein NKH18_02780 [Streptomyces sp. M10(2022)]
MRLGRAPSALFEPPLVQTGRPSSVLARQQANEAVVVEGIPVEGLKVEGRQNPILRSQPGWSVWRCAVDRARALQVKSGCGGRSGPGLRGLVPSATARVTTPADGDPG